MQIQKINGQNYSANKQNLRVKENPSFGWVLLPTREFKEASARFGIFDDAVKIIAKAFKRNQNLMFASMIDKGMIKTNYGDVFGSSMEVFASRRADDFKSILNAAKVKAKKITELTNYVEKLKKSKNINIEFEKGTIDSPDHVLFGDITPIGEHYKKGEYFRNIKASIGDAASAFAKLWDKDDYKLVLGFDDSKPGIVKAKLVDRIGFFRNFDLKTKHNSDTISMEENMLMRNWKRNL